MQKGLPPPSGHKQKSQPSGRDFASPLHHQLQRTDGNPSLRWPKPRTRGSKVNSDAGKEEPGMIKRASHKRSTPDSSHSCGFTTACAMRQAALPAHSWSPLHCLAPQHDRGKRCPRWLFGCLCHGCKQQHAYCQCQKIAIYLSRVNSTSRDLQGIAVTNLGPNNTHKSLTTEARCSIPRYSCCCTAQGTSQGGSDALQQAGIWGSVIVMTAELLLTAPRVNADPF